MSGATIFIREDLKISDRQVEILTGILSLCALVCSLTAGVGVGYALMIAPVYSAEISAPLSRGFLTSLPALCISLGLTLKLGWRMMLGIAAVPSLALAIGVLKMPESPRWLVMQGRLKDANEVVLQICNSKEEAKTRLREIKSAVGIDEHCTDDIVKLSKKTHGQGVWKELLLRPTPSHTTGIDAVVLYSPTIFKKAGVTSKDKLLLATIGVGLTKTPFTLVATFFLDRVGRRRLLLTSIGGMIMALAALGSGLTTVEHHSTEKLKWALGLSIGAVYIFAAFYSSGLSPITWVYSSEIFPLKLRAQGASIGVAVNRAMNATPITIGGAFYLFTGVSVLAWIFFYFFLPETKGRSLEEIEKVFGRNRDNL
ncbi:hypothetical protein AQUCO_01000450v1 [Aquilegia coerulea]|uniref:Major facilitator superfamily (MFS) profile domain-containing protein n=1 Tax=Aquilegia coerulea TaxID=218851 RepID=A0A2G5E9Y6_AQUCA|nr:hypothetical protein AQUCO_01000450v1 [Aquilegia coerulea]